MIADVIDREALAKTEVIADLRARVQYHEQAAEEVVSELERLTEELTAKRDGHLYKASAFRSVVQDLDRIMEARKATSWGNA